MDDVQDGDQSPDEEEDDEMEEERLSEHSDESPSKPTSPNVPTPNVPALGTKGWPGNLSPYEAWKLRRAAQSSNSQNQSSSATSVSDTPAATNDALLQQFRSEVLDGDLFQALKTDRSKAFRVKGLLQQLNNPSSPRSLIAFIVAFGPHLDQTARDLEERQRRLLIKERAEESCAEAKKAMDSSSDKVSTLEEQAAQDKRRLDEYDAEITHLRADIEELQSQLKAAEEKKAKAQRETKPKAIIEEELNKAAAICLEHSIQVERHEATIAKLVEEEQFLDMRLEQAKSLFDSLKAKLDL